MIRLLLIALNAPAIVLLATLGVAIQTSFFAPNPLFYLQPDVVLVLVIWCALKRNFTEGGILTLILGNLSEIHSSSPQGVMLISYMVVYLATRGMSRVLVIPTLASMSIMTIGASMVWKIAGLLVLHLLGAAENQWRHTMIFLFPGAVIQGLVGYWANPLLDRFDWITFKNPRARQILEDEVLLEGEGF